MPRKRRAAREFRKNRPSDHERVVKWLLANPFRLLDTRLAERMHATFEDLTTEGCEAAIAEAEQIDGEARYRAHIRYQRRQMAEWPVSLWVHHCLLSGPEGEELRQYATVEQIAEYDRIIAENAARLRHI